MGRSLSSFQIPGAVNCPNRYPIFTPYVLIHNNYQTQRGEFSYTTISWVVVYVYDVSTVLELHTARMLGLLPLY